MASYTAPSENLAIFDPTVFINDLTPITIAEGDKRYLRFPFAQGTEYLSAIFVGGVATFSDNTIFTDNWVLNDTQTTPTRTISATCLPATNVVLELKANTGGAVWEETNITQNGVAYTAPAGTTTTKTWLDILTGAGSVGTLNSVLANGNTATGTYANINLVDTDPGGQANPIMTLQNTNATGSVALEVYKNKPTAGVAGDVLFNQSVYGKDSALNKQEYTRITHTLRDGASGGEDGSIELGCFVNGSFNNFLQINGNENEVNCLKILDMGGNNIRTNTGSLTMTSVGSSGTGDLTVSAKNTATLTGLGVAITSSGSAGEKITLTAPATSIDLVPTTAIRTDSNITTLTTAGGSLINFAGGNPDERFNIDKNDITLHWNNASGEQADIVLESDIASLNSAINMNYQTTGGNMGTTIQNIPATQRIIQTDGINNKSYQSSPTKVELIEGSNVRIAKIENSVNNNENRLDLFLNQGSGITDNAGIVNQVDNQLLYLVHTDNAVGKSIQLLNPLNSVGGLNYSNTMDTNPCNIQSTHTSLQLSAPFATAGSGDIIFAPETTGGNLIFTGTNLEANISGPQTSQYLKIRLNGTDYKIALFNP